MNLQYAAVINNSDIVGCTPWHRSRVIILHEGALLSAVRCLSYYWEKEEKKRLSRTMYVDINIIVNPQKTQR